MLPTATRTNDGAWDPPGVRMAPVVRGAGMALVLSVVVLPAGDVASVPLKHVLFLVALALFGTVIAARGRLPRDAARIAAGGVALAALVAGWFALGLIRGTTERGVALQALSSFGTTIAVAVLIGMLVGAGMILLRGLVRGYLLGATAFAAAKVTVALLVFLGILPFRAVAAIVEQVFHYDFVSMLIVPGVVRMHFVNDVFAPFSLFLLLSARHLGLRIRASHKWTAFALLLVSILLAYSRFLFVATALLMVIWLFALGRQRIATIAASLALLLGFSLALLASDDLRAPLSQRFASEQVVVSDEIRVRQADALLGEIAHRPVLGKGIGGYVESFVRSASHRYSYELQWLSILLQMGVLGTAALLTACIAIGTRLARDRPAAVAAALLGAFSVWVASGLTNPYLLSSTSGAMFGLFLALGRSPTLPADRQRHATPGSSTHD